MWPDIQNGKPVDQNGMWVEQNRTREEQKGGAHGYQLMLYHIVLYVSLRYIMVKDSTI